MIEQNNKDGSIGDGHQASLNKFMTSLDDESPEQTEAVKSRKIYSSEYQGPKPIREQVEFLAKEFNLSSEETTNFIENVLPMLTLPEGAEGWFAIPSIDAVAAQFFPKITDPNDRYCHAVRLVLKKINKFGKFYSCRDLQITPSRFRQHERTIRAIDEITQKQKGDILIIPAQFGMHHFGHSVRKARQLFVDNEFGLGAFAVGCMLLTHPKRSSLWMLITDCAGDEFSSQNDGKFLSTRLFGFSEGRVRFTSSYINCAGVRRGSASGFIPQ